MERTHKQWAEVVLFWGGLVAVGILAKYSPGTAFVGTNVAITLGYVFLAAVVVPRITVRLTRTRWGGIVFFLTCGLHHLDNVFHFLFAGDLPVAEVYVEPHMLIIDIPQAFAVWAFVTGLYIELVRWGPWGVDPGLVDESTAPQAGEKL